MKGRKDMIIKVTSRHFKAHNGLVEYAEDIVSRLEKFYDGVMECDVILSYEKAINSKKHAEINLLVQRTKLNAEAISEDFHKSIDEALGKMEIQLKKYKEKLKTKNRIKAQKAKIRE